ncbi:pitrilysin family protein [Thermodesulfobacterium sp.]|jgi:zinc protease|uniref:M16 family metallopeptidase n=1 Tax=Thermodesulfobacterium sp. TaxID=1965289 RepID=UPI002648CA86|nr:pitrilysin family protein [Thermodesulfobacterium sp.]MDN5380163.1 zinc protease [Thermodesulfobacterium sp.]
MLKKLFWIVFFIILFLGGFSMPGEAKKSDYIVDKVVEKKLANGLTVLFYPYEREDVVTVKLCVKVGSAYENEKQAGITHLIEHMIFKGTESKKPEDIVGEIEALGGYMNAFTSFDYTCYYTTGPTKILEKSLDILSDIVFHPYFDPKELEREKEVVVEEMKMRLDNPHVVLFEEVMKASYQKYPYRRPIIGYEETVRSFKREDLLSFINQFYTPENMLLSVVGKIPQDELFSLINKYFTNLPKRKLKKVKFPEEPFTEKPKLVWVERPVKEGYFVFTLPGVSFREEDAPLLDLLVQALGGGESSRLYVRLKRELNLVKTISMSAFSPVGPGLIEIYGTADPEKFKDIVSHLITELEEIKNLGITEEELQKAKVQLLSDFVFDAETSDGLSSTLSFFQLKRGNYRDILWYKNKIEQATVEDLKEVAKKYFNFDKLVGGFLSEKRHFDEEDFKKLLSLKKDSPVKFFTLENKLKVIVYPRKDLPTVGITLAFPGGLRFETPQTNGLFQALTLLWTRGTQKYSAEEISSKLEALGATIKGFSGRNTFGLKALSLSFNFDQTLELFKEILLTPTFKEEECEKARPELISMIFMQEDNPISLAVNQFLKILFPDHPYGLNIAGDLNFYQNFKAEDLRQAYQKFVTPEKAVLTVVGDVDPFILKQKLESYLKDWKTSKVRVKEEEEPKLPSQKTQKIKKETFQNQILLGFQTPGLNSKEKLVLEILSSALSGQDGRLFRILRDERSLAYSVTSFTVFYPKKSAFVLYIGCSPEKEEAAIAGFWEILEEVSKKGLTLEEIERAKNRLLGKLKIGLQSNLAKSEDIAVNEVLNLGWDYSQNYENMLQYIKQEDIQKFIKTYLKKENAVLFILGK